LIAVARRSDAGAVRATGQGTVEIDQDVLFRKVEQVASVPRMQADSPIM